MIALFCQIGNRCKAVIGISLWFEHQRTVHPLLDLLVSTPGLALSAAQMQSGHALYLCADALEVTCCAKSLGLLSSSVCPGCTAGLGSILYSVGLSGSDKAAHAQQGGLGCSKSRVQTYRCYQPQKYPAFPFVPPVQPGSLVAASPTQPEHSAHTLILGRVKDPSWVSEFSPNQLV